MDAYTIAWIIWGIGFAGIEGAALVSHTTGGTLSEHVWSWFRVSQGWGKIGVAIPRAVLLLSMVWLLLHLAFGWPKVLGGFA